VSIYPSPTQYPIPLLSDRYVAMLHMQIVIWASFWSSHLDIDSLTVEERSWISTGTVHMFTYDCGMSTNLFFDKFTCVGFSRLINSIDSSDNSDTFLWLEQTNDMHQSICIVVVLVSLIPEIERSSTSNNMMFSVETTSSFVFAFDRFGYVERFLIVIRRSIVDCQTISKIFHNRFRS
jgi:hypothetical protein